MRARIGAVLVVAALIGSIGAAAHAEAPAPSSSHEVAPPAPAATVNQASLAKGVAVVAIDGATDAAWPLAQAVYGTSGLRPAAMTDEIARVLAGEPPKEGAPAKLRDLGELRAAIHGDDAPSRRLLASLGHEVGASSIAVVFPNGAMRVFVVESGAFDPTALASEVDAAGKRTWNGATAWLVARMPPQPKTAPPQKEEGGSFLSSGWFWGAIVIAGVLGAGAYALSKPSGSDTSTSIPLTLRVQRLAGGDHRKARRREAAVVSTPQFRPGTHTRPAFSPSCALSLTAAALRPRTW